MKKKLFWLAFAALVVLHHDWWYWNDGTLVFGFLPVGLAYHVGYSIAATALWAVAVFYVMSDVFEADPKEVQE